MQCSRAKGCHTLPSLEWWPCRSTRGSRSHLPCRAAKCDDSAAQSGILQARTLPPPLLKLHKLPIRSCLLLQRLVKGVLCCVSSYANSSCSCYQASLSGSYCLGRCVCARHAFFESNRYFGHAIRSYSGHANKLISIESCTTAALSLHAATMVSSISATFRSQI